jgi:hypothetical protein
MSQGFSERRRREHSLCRLPGKQAYISTGHLIKDNSGALILVDYPREARLKILEQAEILHIARCKSGPSGFATPHAASHGGTDQRSVGDFEQRLADLEQENRRFRKALTLSEIRREERKS